MPFRRSYARRRYPPHHRRRRRIPNIATRPRFMPSRLKSQRFNQVSSKIFYVKSNGQIQANAVGNYKTDFNTRDIVAAPPAGVSEIANLYDEYKVLAIYLKLFPANVGAEPFNLNRGDVVVWSDQRQPFQSPTSVAGIINFGSARLINPRNPYHRRLFRAKGNPDWGNTSLGSPQFVPDQWDAQISVAGFNGTPVPAGSPQPVCWYYTITYKLLVRGRRQP